MGFWLKRILVMLVVIIGAAAFIIFMPQHTTLDKQGNPVEKRSIEANMAKFYEDFGLVSSDIIEEKFGDFVIPLEPPSAPLSQQLSGLKRPALGSSADFNWQGSVKSRAFAQDSTIMTNANSYVLAEGMQLIWHLNQDFIVRHRFLSENTVSGMLQELAGAIDANFLGKVEVYYCKSQRAMVITDKTDPALQANCVLLEQY